MSRLEDGFSLLECLLVAGLSLVLMSGVATHFERLDGHRLVNMQLWEICRGLELTRSMARSQGQIWTACFSNDDDRCVRSYGVRWQVWRDDNQNRRLDIDEKAVSKVVLDGLDLWIKLSASGRPYVRFKRSGEALESGNFLVCWRNGLDYYPRKVIFFRSGRIRFSNRTEQAKIAIDDCPQPAAKAVTEMPT